MPTTTLIIRCVAHGMVAQSKNRGIATDVSDQDGKLRDVLGSYPVAHDFEVLPAHIRATSPCGFRIM